MSGKLKRMWPAAAASLIALSSVAQADNGTSGDMSRAKQRPNSMNAQNGQHVAQVINPPARPVVKDGVDLFLQGEFLWWRPALDDNQFAASCGFCPAGVTPYDGYYASLMNTYGMTVLSPDYKMDAGFRVGIGYNMPYDGWDVYLRWTRLHTNASNRTCCEPCCEYSTCEFDCEPACEVQTCDTGCDIDDCDTGCQVASCDVGCESPCAPGVCETPCDPCDLPECMQLKIIPGFPCRTTFDNFVNVCSAESEWKIDLDLIDLELGREFYVSRKLTLRPNFGLRQAWVDMSQTVTYTAQINNFPARAGYLFTDASAADVVYMKNRFRGIGPRAGLDSRWMIGGGVSILGEVALAILYGHYTVQTHCCTCVDGYLERTSAAPYLGTDQSDQRPSQLNDTFFTSKGVADLGLGLEWQGTFSDDRWGLELALLWDNSLYFNQNQQIGIMELTAPGDVADSLFTQASLSPRRHGDFSTQGLTVRARLNF